MRLAIGLLVAAVAFAGARVARTSAKAMRQEEAVNRPYAPSRSAAPFVSLGYREAMADILYVRMIGYFNGEDSTGRGVADLAEAIVTLSPDFKRVYDHGANAMTLAKHEVDQSVFRRAVALLEIGLRRFPDDWRMPYLAAQMYTQDLKTEDERERRAWDERATLLVESAARKPGAPTGAATWGAMLRTRLGQHERAIATLREMLLVTDDERARKRLIDALATLQEKDSAAVAGEIYAERRKFDRRYKAERPYVTPSMYILLGPRIAPGFDVVELATGGRDLFVQDEETVLEPLE